VPGPEESHNPFFDKIFLSFVDYRAGARDADIVDNVDIDGVVQ
jgi:hypothetical protein